MTLTALVLIMFAGLVAGASPGPATLALASTSMTSGRGHGLALAAGISLGSLIWSVSAALGLAALIAANGWAFEAMRYFGAAYLLFLAYKSARSAISVTPRKAGFVASGSLKNAFLRGLLLHLTNPKAVLFFGALYSVGVPPTTGPAGIALVIACIAVQSTLLFHGYALLFSTHAMIAGYKRLQRWFDSLAACVFGAFGLKLITTRLEV